VDDPISMAPRCPRLPLLLLASLIVALAGGRAAIAEEGDTHFGLEQVAEVYRQPGVRLVAVDFYGEWCPPCKKEVPSWNRLLERYRKRGLRLIVVSVREEKLGASSCPRVGLAGDQKVCDPEEEIAEAWHVREMPASFLWSWQGKRLVEHGRVGDIEAAVESFFEQTFQVYIDTPTGPGGVPLDAKVADALAGAVDAELRASKKFEVVAGPVARKRIREVRASFGADPGTDERERCDLGRELPPDTLLRVVVDGDGITLHLDALESGCGVHSVEGTISGRAWARGGRAAAAALVRAVSEAAEAPKARVVTGASVKRNKASKRAGGGATPAIEDDTGYLLVDTKPTGASIFVDGDAHGTTTNAPRFIELPFGDHMVEARLDLHHPGQQRVEVTTETGELSFELKPAYGALLVESTPPGADVWLDGVRVGTTPWRDERRKSGIYRLVIKLDRHRPFEGSVTVADEESATRRTTLIPTYGTLTVESVPGGADLWLDDEKVGATPWTGARAAGPLTIRVAKAFHQEVRELARVVPGRHERVSLTLPEDRCRLEVASEPPGASVALNDRPQVGVQTPHAFDPVEPGLYRVTLAREGYFPTTGSIECPRGHTSQHAAILSPRLGRLDLVTTWQDGAICRGKVHVDGEEKGLTPLKLDLSATEHEIRVVCEDSQRVERVRVEEGKKTKLNWTLAKKTAPGRDSAAGIAQSKGTGSVWTDPQTHLVWQRTASAAAMNWKEAEAYCRGNQAGLPGGRWRLPSISELRSIVKGCLATATHGTCNVSELGGGCLSWGCRDSSCNGCASGGGPGEGGDYIDSVFNTSAHSWFWSSSPREDNPDAAWNVNFDTGVVNFVYVLGARGVRCVRSGP
jgi:thiol-disulfide isomerase/thioredoxin